MKDIIAKNMNMNMKNITDKFSICLSMCCILHCLALPVLIVLLPSISSLWINDEIVHVYLVLLAIPISLFAMVKSLKVHNNYKCISLAVIGLLLLIAAIFMHDIGSFFGEQGHGEEKGHVEEHGHDEHHGIGGLLEKIFTVLGALILVGAHILNLRFSKKIA
jgi:hypothetical protein